MENKLTQIYYGQGKGKTTAAVGIGIRAIGNEQKVIMIQFMKADGSGECKVLKNLEPYFKVFHFERKRELNWQLTGEEMAELQSETLNALKFASKVMDTGECDVLILDEILNSVEWGVISEEQICELIESKSSDVELILTGRKLPLSIADKADYIIKVDDIKKPNSELI